VTPKLINRPLRDQRFLLCFSADELTAIRACAVAAHMPTARYIREVVLGYTPKPKRHAMNAEAIRTLASVGNTLRALVGDAEDAGFASIAEAAEAAIAQILGLIAELNQRGRG
jgi:hypothetical protein